MCGTIPGQSRPWVITEAGRASKIGSVLECKKCDEEKVEAPPDY
jgi:hypothetical protein